MRFQIQEDRYRYIDAKTVFLSYLSMSVFFYL